MSSVTEVAAAPPASARRPPSEPALARAHRHRTADVHGHPRQPRHDERPARAARRVRGIRRGAAVVHERLHPRVREHDPHGRGPRRPVRSANALPHRHRRVHAELGVRRTRRRSRPAHRRPRTAGLRRRGDHAALAHAARRFGAARAASARDRHLGRRRRPRRRDRAAHRRRRDRGLGLAGDLLDQRARRRRVDRARPARAAEQLRRPAPRRHRGPRALGPRPARHSSSASCAATKPAGTASRCSAASSRGGILLVAFVLWEGARDGAAAAAAAVPRPQLLAWRTSWASASASARSGRSSS